jgi:hypothetical protein
MEIKWWLGTIHQVQTDCTRIQQPTLHTPTFVGHMRQSPSNPRKRSNAAGCSGVLLTGKVER